MTDRSGGMVDAMGSAWQATRAGWPGGGSQVAVWEGPCGLAAWLAGAGAGWQPIAATGQTLLIAGYGTDKYRSQAEGVEGIRFLGPVDDQRLDGLLREVLGTLIYQESGSGALTKIAEMLLAGVPVLANSHAMRSYDNLKGIFEFARLEQLTEFLGDGRLAGAETALPKAPDAGALLAAIQAAIATRARSAG